MTNLEDRGCSWSLVFLYRVSHARVDLFTDLFGESSFVTATEDAWHSGTSTVHQHHQTLGKEPGGGGGEQDTQLLIFFSGFIYINMFQH